MSNPAVILETREDGRVVYKRSRHGGAVRPGRNHYPPFNESDERIPEKTLDDVTGEEKEAESLEDFFLNRYPDILGYPVWVDGVCFKRLEKGLWIECRMKSDFISDEFRRSDSVSGTADEEKLEKTDKEVIDFRDRVHE